MKKSTKITIISVAIICIACLIFVGCNYQEVEHDNFTYSALGVSSTTNPYDTYYDMVEEEKTETEQEVIQTKIIVDDNFEYGKLVADTQYQKSQKGVEKVMLVKMISENEIEELNPDYIIVDGVVYTNPKNNPDIDLKALGYKNFFIDDVPEFDGETQKAERYYYDNGDTIHRGWKIYNLTKEELEAREKMNALLKGE